MDELKACPFCGSSNTTLDYYEISCPQELGTIVVCNDCGASAKSIVDWNTRPIEDALNARIAELERDKKALRGIEENLREHIDIGTLQLSVATARIAELTAHSDIERQDDKSSNDTQTQTIVYGKEDSEVQE